MTRFPEGNYHVPKPAWVRDLRRYRGLPVQDFPGPVRTADWAVADHRLVRLHRLRDLPDPEARRTEHGCPRPGDDRGATGGVRQAGSGGQAVRRSGGRAVRRSAKASRYGLVTLSAAKGHAATY